MLSSERTIALYCPACEQLQQHKFSLFELSGSLRSFQCACGFKLGHITKKKRRYEVRLLCSSGDRVRLLYPFREFWLTPLLTFYSPDEGEILGFFGNDQDVSDIVASSNNDLLEPDDFLEPEIMSSVLAYLQKLAVANKISCACNHPGVGIDIYPDKVELVCSNCGSAMLIGATMEADLTELHNLNEITMQAASYTFLGELIKS